MMVFDGEETPVTEQNKFEECEYCAGTGQVPEAQTAAMSPNLPAMVECGKCKGSGQMPRSSTPT
jgi:DnaJ-class molecular chaperone